jgi:adenylate cyclase
VAASPLLSATRRFFQKFSVAFFWAAFFGGILGGAVFFRVPRPVFHESRPWHYVARMWLEQLELSTYDWRARALGESAVRSDEVVLAVVDDDTLASAREASDETLSVRPWPRDVYGAVAEQALREGATMVELDVALNALSPRTCPPCKGEKPKSDDDALFTRLSRLGPRVIVPFAWSEEPSRPPDRELRPWLLQAGQFGAEREAWQGVREVLANRVPAYLEGADGGVTLWAAAASEEKAQQLASVLQVRGSPEVRQQTPDDDQSEVGSGWLLVQHAAVTVSGMDPANLPTARSLDGPVPKVLTAETLLGVGRLLPDYDGVVRGVQHLVAVDLEGKRYVVASASLRAAMKLLEVKELRWADGRLYLGGRATLPMDETGYSLVQWDADEVGNGGRGSLKRAIPVWRLWLNLGDDDAKKGVRHFDNELTGKVVMLGENDIQPAHTPIGMVSRVGISGQALVNAIHSKGVIRADPKLDLWLTAAFALAGAVLAVAWSSLFKRGGWLGSLVVLAAVGALYAFTARHLFIEQQRWVAMAAPLLALSGTFLASLGYAAALEQSVRDFLTRALGRALPPDLLHRIQGDTKLIRPDRRSVAVYFSDIEGFTALSSKLPPAELVGMLREYLDQMTREVLTTSGHIDKYLGDGLMAVWGAPVQLGSPAKNACEAALSMKKRFDSKKASWEKRVGAPLVFRAAIDVGEAVVGEMGTEHRINYTVMGEPVATAARLETLSKTLGALILVSEEVTQAAGAGFVFRELDLVRIKRRPAPVRVFELIGTRSDAGARATTISKWNAALAAWRTRRFAEARQLFAELASTGQDPMALKYVERCAAFEQKPPPPNWDGVVEPPI